MHNRRPPSPSTPGSTERCSRRTRPLPCSRRATLTRSLDPHPLAHFFPDTCTTRVPFLVVTCNLQASPSSIRHSLSNANRTRASPLSRLSRLSLLCPTPNPQQPLWSTPRTAARLFPRCTKATCPIPRSRGRDLLPCISLPVRLSFLKKDTWCTGFQNSALTSKDGQDMILFGDLVLSNKLVVYDLENQVVGWTEYNCSSSIKILDDKTNAVYTVDAHNLSSADRLDIERFIVFLIATYLMFKFLH